MIPGRTALGRKDDAGQANPPWQEMSEYRHNHYVPEWYQKRFLMPGESELYHLDLEPDFIQTPKGAVPKRSLHRWGPRVIFAQEDLYTLRWGKTESTDLERVFFGDIDREGKKAVEFWARFTRHADITEDPSWALYSLLAYMTVQKLRTPKGLAWLMLLTGSPLRNEVLAAVHRLQQLYGAIWTEAIWQFADASASPTKFIISDHPVVVYNRRMPPKSVYCRGPMDPDVRCVGSHTYFPLSAERLLILTNLAWVRDPYQPEQRLRPNPDFFRGALFNFLSIQTGRQLSEQEVLQINLITKLRANRYIAAAREEWLFPEAILPKEARDWSTMGRGWLFMPDPRNEFMGGEVLIGYKDGRSDAYSPYGHRPWQKGYEDQGREARETRALDRFKAEFARYQGPEWRSVSAEMGNWDLSDRSDSTDMHEHYLEVAKRYSRGRRQRTGRRK